VCLFEWARRRHSGAVALETIVAAAAHDIRSPLTAMKGFGYALEKRWGSMTEEQRTLMLRGIVYDADRMDAILRLLVDAGRVASGSLELFPERVDLSELALGIIESVRRDTEHPEVRWGGEADVVVTDPARARSAILSFIESQVWWGREGPITIEGRRVGRPAASHRLARWVGAHPEDAERSSSRPVVPARSREQDRHVRRPRCGGDAGRACLGGCDERDGSRSTGDAAPPCGLSRAAC
jgi:light-regulated signal transduction histidine kinase (bacteriophytochrome)